MRLLRFFQDNGTNIQGDEVCETNQLVTGLLDSERKAHVNLWYTHDNSFYRAVCYFWCTKDGAIPTPSPDLVRDYDLVAKLVKKKQGFNTYSYRWIAKSTKSFPFLRGLEAGRTIPWELVADRRAPPVTTCPQWPTTSSPGTPQAPRDPAVPTQTTDVATTWYSSGVGRSSARAR